MGKAISTTIKGQFFRTKGELTKFMRALVDHYQLGEFLNAEDTEFCLALFETHPNYPKKLAPGVESIQLRIQEQGTNGFQIHKTDGTSDNISWTDCVANIK